jgi:predicted CopG family antitoxin
MNILTIFKKKSKIKENGSFSEFFRTASPKEQIKVLTRAAEMANRDQRKLMEEVGAIR